MPETIGQRHYGVIRIHICCSKESMHTSVNLRNLKNGSVSILCLFSFCFIWYACLCVLFPYFFFSLGFVVSNSFIHHVISFSGCSECSEKCLSHLVQVNVVVVLCSCGSLKFASLISQCS